MGIETTSQALATIRDPALFERLATAILREANPNYISLVHSGMNVAGKTIKSPVDGICFIPNVDPPHMIVVHHTITVSKDLEKKWLHDPSTVKPRKGKHPTAPAGDMIKTIELVVEERKHTPNLHVTLVLTTNEEPSEALVRTIETEARNHGLVIDLWSRSRLTHFLDNNPSGQWLRHLYLGIKQELLSKELLHALSKESLAIYRPPDNPKVWVARSLDTTLATPHRRNVTFLVAGSGFGKSVACYRMLTAHVESGGFGFVLPHEVVASAISLEQAVTMALQQLHPLLTTVSAPILSFCSPDRTLLLVVEDINRSDKTPLLMEKLVGWNPASKMKGNEPSILWHLICPLWPEILSSLNDQTRKRIESLVIIANGFSESEGCDAVLAQARFNNRELSSVSAKGISRELGQDPLLIALHEQHVTPEPHNIISQFIEGALSRVALQKKDFPATEYRLALLVLATEMLTNRQFELRWHEISAWAQLQGQPLRLISHLAHQGEIIRFVGASNNQRLLFRHDRVKDWLLANAVNELDQKSLLPKSVLAEPYFAEIIGIALFLNPNSKFLQRISSSNPLAIFQALRLFGQAKESHYEDILLAINDWLNNQSTHDSSNNQLRWEALAMLAETDSSKIPNIVRKFSVQTTNAQIARFRNGDITGGMELCFHIEPGLGAVWRDIQIEHVKLRYGSKLIKTVDDILRKTDLSSVLKIGIIRLAGHIADPDLLLAIEACWTNDNERENHLADYLWAFAECCKDNPARFLEPVCNIWAKLSDQPETKGHSSPRDELIYYSVRFAFNKWPPSEAVIDYFVQRGTQDDLRTPIIMMLHGVDQPKAVLFIVHELAAHARKIEGTDYFSSFSMMVRDHWRRQQNNNGRPMSIESRSLLLGLWQDETNDKHLRTQAFSSWAMTQYPDDIEVLRTAKSPDILDDAILKARLTRGDQQAIQGMIEKLSMDDNGYWWQYGRNIWSLELTNTLDNYLENRGAKTSRDWGKSFKYDDIIYEMILRLSINEAERLLLKHWAHLRFSHYFIQTALYVATPQLLELVKTVFSECPEPTKLMEHLHFHFGIKMTGHPGLVSESQVLALAPYLHLLSPLGIEELWQECNERGWFTIRRKLLDNLLSGQYLKLKWEYNQVISELDKMVAEIRLIWVDHWIDTYIKTDVSWAEILKTMIEWLEERRSFEALKVVASAISHRGTREDLCALKTYEAILGYEARKLIADTNFTVRRKSIY